MSNKPPAITDAASCLVYSDWVRDTSGDEVNAACWQLVGEVRMVLDPLLEQLTATSGRADHQLKLPHSYRLSIDATAKRMTLSLYSLTGGKCVYVARYYWLRHSCNPKRHYAKRTHQLVRKMFDLLHPAGTELHSS